MHQLTEIRQAAAALLRHRFKRVFEGRLTAPAQADLPCVAVYAEGRSSEVFNAAPLEIRHTVQLATVVCVSANRDAETLAEEMLVLVEKLFYANPTLRHTAADGSTQDTLADDLLPESLYIETAEEGETATVYYRQTWRAVYHDAAADYVGGDAEYRPQAQIGAVLLQPGGGPAHYDWQIKSSNEEIDAADILPKQR